MLNTYPIKNPQHGGQKRAAAIFQRYLDLGHEVQYIGIYTKDSYKERGSHDVLITSGESLELMNEYNTKMSGDYATGIIALQDAGIYKSLLDKISVFKPDVIQVEHPYLASFVLYLKDEKIVPDFRFIYSSHNVEWMMKEDMIRGSSDISDDEKKRVTHEIKELETRATIQADMVIAVTDSDKEKLEDMGAKKVILAPNGIDSIDFSEAAIAKQRRVYEHAGIEKTVVFVGSWHQPNWQGFMDNLTTGLGYLKINTKVIVVGGVGGLIQEYFNTGSVIERTCFLQRAQLMGRVPEHTLTSIIALADVIVLPISEGGGSNLKTAEALLSGRPVVATKHAMRGYEGFEGLKGVTIADGAKFRQAVAHTLYQTESMSTQRTKQDELMMGRLLWSTTLKSLGEVTK